METNSLLVALGLLLFGGGENEVTPTPLNETYITSTDSHCKIHNQNPQPNETVTWSGACVNGFANGQGTVQWYQNGKKTDVFVGSYLNGKTHGKGKYTWGKGQWEGDVYEGDYLNGKKHGKGKYIWSNGYMYEGNYLNGQKNGQGKTTGTNGNIYEGGYLNNQKNGYGKIFLVKDDKHINSWKNDNIGYWQGDVYIVQGIFEDGTLKIECSSLTECKKKQANQK